MNINKNMRIYSLINSTINLDSHYRNTCRLNIFYETDNINKIKFQISLPGVCPFPTSLPRLTGHHVPPLKPNLVMN